MGSGCSLDHGIQLDTQHSFKEVAVARGHREEFLANLVSFQFDAPDNTEISVDNDDTVIMSLPNKARVIIPFRDKITSFARNGFECKSANQLLDKDIMIIKDDLFYFVALRICIAKPKSWCYYKLNYQAYQDKFTIVPYIMNKGGEREKVKNWIQYPDCPDHAPSHADHSPHVAYKLKNYKYNPQILHQQFEIITSRRNSK